MTDIEVIMAKQDGRISRVEACMTNQNGRLERIEGKLDRLYLWLVGLMGGVIASLVLLVINLAIRRN